MTPRERQLEKLKTLDKKLLTTDAEYVNVHIAKGSEDEKELRSLRRASISFDSVQRMFF
jgi:hypothetical protein